MKAVIKNFSISSLFLKSPLENELVILFPTFHMVLIDFFLYRTSNRSLSSFSSFRMFFLTYVTLSTFKKIDKHSKNCHKIKTSCLQAEAIKFTNKSVFSVIASKNRFENFLNNLISSFITCRRASCKMPAFQTTDCSCLVFEISHSRYVTIYRF